MFPTCLVQPQVLSVILALQAAGGCGGEHKSLPIDAPSAVKWKTTVEELRQRSRVIPAVIVLMPPLLTKGSGHWTSVTGVAETETQTHQPGII